MTGPLARWRTGALRATAALIAFATITSLAKSATGLYGWALHHGWPVWSAWMLPAMVDTFIVVGELALFVGMVDRWPGRWRAMGWVSVGAGWVVSVAGNAGHAGWQVPVWDLVTYGIPPTALAGVLLIGLAMLKHTVARQPGGVSVTVPAGRNGHPPLPSVRELMARRTCSQGTAQKMQAEVKHDRAVRVSAAVPVQREGVMP